MAYGSQEILLQLTLAGAVGMHYTLAVSFVIPTVLVLVTLSYQQTIHAYPSGTTALRVGDRIALVLVAQVNRGLLPALDYARRMGSDCSALHVAVLPEETPPLQSLWARWGEDIPLVILESPYRSLLGPLLDYIRKVQNDRPGCLVTIVMPQFVSSRWWERLLRHNAAVLIRWGVLPLRGVVVVEVPYALEESTQKQA